MRTLDLRGNNSLFANERIEKPIKGRNHRSGQLQSGNGRLRALK
jgi:hypothetical protein